MALETNRPIAMFLRTGTLNDPFHFIQETDRKVSDRGIIVLREIPVNQAGFVFDDGATTETDPTAIQISIEQGGSTISFTEIKDPSADLQAFQYRVDYYFGVVSFDIEAHAGLENVNISYVGKGAFFISASRIYSDTDFTQDGGQFPITLQNILEEIDPTFNITEVYADATERDADTSVDNGTISITQAENELAVFQDGT
jgi:hypothetical protein